MRIRFSSVIKLVSGSQFKKLAYYIKDKEYTDENSGIEKRVTLQKRGCTEYAFDCNAGGVHNTEHVTLFHLYPPDAIKFIPNIKKHLTEDIKKLAEKGPVRALITAGRAYQDSNRYEASFKLFNALKNIIKDAEVRNLSIIWGRTSWKTNGATNVIYDSDKDTWYLNIKNDAGRDVVTEKELYKTFKIVSIAQGDTLEFSKSE